MKKDEIERMIEEASDKAARKVMENAGLRRRMGIARCEGFDVQFAKSIKSCKERRITAIHQMAYQWNYDFNNCGYFFFNQQ